MTPMRIDRGKLARIEHDKKLKAYLKENLDVLVQRQKLVKNGKVKTNIAILDLPTLRFGKPEQEQLMKGKGGGQGGKGEQQQGQPQPGEGQEGDEKVEVSGTKGADDHGDAQTVEVDFDDFVRMAQEQLLDELELPAMRPPGVSGDMPSSENFDLMEIDRPGLPADMNLERTMTEALKRNIRERGEADYEVDVRQDAWYFSETPDTEKTNRALEVYLLDISGSVSGHNIALIRKFIFILWYYLDQKYTMNARRFIVFQDEAEEVTKEQFFAIESKGGTHISAGFEQALQGLDGFEQYDKFLFFFSDGDNSSSDDEAAIEALNQVIENFDMICYGRINPCDSPISPFNALMKKIVADCDFLTFADIKDLDNVRETIDAFLDVLGDGAPKRKARRP